MWAQGRLETSCGGSTVDDLITLAGGRNVCADQVKEHAIVHLESILRWNPEVIVIWHGQRLTPDDIINDPHWRSITAVRERRVHQLPEVFLCDLWTLKFQYAVKLVAKWTHPEVYAEMDLERERTEMLRFLYGTSLQAP